MPYSSQVKIAINITSINPVYYYTHYIHMSTPDTLFNNVQFEWINIFLE